MTRPRTATEPRSRANRADRYRLYQQAVQDPEPEVDFIQRVYRRVRGRAARSFREDFCATALLATTWVKGHRRRTAIGIDISDEPLSWAREHVLGPEPAHVRERVELIRANVLDVTKPKVDVACAFNFSYCIFKTRRELLRYFANARDALDAGGVFFCDLFGGTEAIMPITEERSCGSFTYVWQHAAYNAVTSEIRCHIHFRFRDGSELREAFSYDWRLWTIPEVRECLIEAGFRDTMVWWDPAEDNLGYRLTEAEENQEGWLVYIVGIK